MTQHKYRYEPEEGLRSGHPSPGLARTSQLDTHSLYGLNLSHFCIILMTWTSIINYSHKKGKLLKSINVVA